MSDDPDDEHDLHDHGSAHSRSPEDSGASPRASGSRERGHGHGHGNHDAHHAHDIDELGVGVVTVSSTRTVEDDPSGDAVADIVGREGHTVAIRELIADDYDRVQSTVRRIARRDDVDCVVTTGGTGVTPDDVTVEAVEPLLDKELPGFGELFRELSRTEIGSRVVATRATAGIIDGVPVFCLPGSESAVRLGTGEIIVREAGHIAGLARRED